MARNQVIVFVAAWHVLAFAYYGFHVVAEGYLPMPFWYDTFDTFMDYFHTTYWAGHDGRYTEWGSIYPIFTFLLAGLASSRDCYHIDAFFARDGCFDIWLYVMFTAALVAAYQNARLFTSNHVERVLVFLAIVLSFPFLFAVERGNYIMYTYVFLVLAASTKGKVAEGIFLACAINLKQYLVILLAHPFLNRDYRVLLSCVVATLVLTAIAVSYLSDPHFMLFWENMFMFTDPEIIGNISRLSYAVSVNSFISFTKLPDGAFFLDLLDYAYPVLAIEHLVWLGRILEVVVYAAIGIIGLRLLQLRGQLEKGYVCYLMIICLLAKFEAPGAYALMLLFPYMPSVLPLLSRSELVALFLLFQPIDYMYQPLWPSTTTSYLSGELVTSEFGLMVGSTLKPASLLYLLLRAALRLLWQARTPPGVRSGDAGAPSLPAAFGNVGR
jgi:hypothetical protein